MPAALVVNGIFQDSTINWLSPTPGGTYDGWACVPNTTNITQTYTGATINGTNAGDFSIDSTQFPVTVNPNQTAIIHVKLAALNHVSVAGVTISTNTTFAPIFYLNGAGPGSQPVSPFPSILVFPNTKVGQTTSFANVGIVNTTSLGITVNNITLTTGTNFFIVGAPIVPFSLASGATSALFTIQFTPTVIGSLLDVLNITPSSGSVGSATLQGVGSTLQSMFSLTGGTVGSLFAMSGGGTPLILLAAPTNLNTEEASSFVKLHDFQQPNVEHQLMRVRGHYEDLGQATITVTAKARRIGQQDEIVPVNISIGTNAADGWIREFTSEPVPITGELIQLTISRAANSGPVSIIDYMPQWETKGEVIGGT